MYIIDETYFVREFRTPNSSEIDISGNNESFDSWIDQQSRLLLQEALGSVNFTALDSQITNGALNNDADQKWKDLVDGKTYTSGGTTYTWKGLKFTEGIFKGSLIVPFVYCKWLEYQLSQQSGFGEVIGSAANSMNVNSTHKYVTSWNKFVEMYQGKYSETNTLSFVNGIPFYDYYQGNDSGYVSLLQFLKDNKTDYPDVACKEYDYLNTFGL